jgi:hypothetical protein
MPTNTAAPMIPQTIGKLVLPILNLEISGNRNCLTAQLPMKAPMMPIAIEVKHPPQLLGDHAHEPADDD